MASPSTSSVLLERSSSVGLVCVIKTGTKQNATYGKSFYICNNLTERCPFANPASVSQTECPLHKEMVELKSFVVKGDGLRCYFRCVYGKETGGKWCGNTKVPNTRTDKLKDITNVAERKTLEATLKDANKLKTSSTSNVKTSFEKNAPQHGSEASQQQQPNSVSTVKHESQATSEHIRKEHAPRKNPLLQREGPLPDSFCVPRSSRISDVSEASSHASETSSHDSSMSSVTNDSIDTDVNHSSKQKTVEVISSSDEDDEEDERASDRIREDAAKYPGYLDSKKKMEPRRNEMDIPSLEKQLKNQEDLLKKFGPRTGDNGKKIRDSIERITLNIQQLKMQETEQEKLDPPSSVQAQLQFPSMAANKNLPSMMANNAGQGDVRMTKVIDIDSLPAHYSASNSVPVDHRNLPIFGGRMTEKRLKEVGRMTKEAIECLHNSLDKCPSASEETEDPDNLNVPLMTHQRQALSWLTWRETQTPSGGILADDMGLGKTLTMISLALKSKQQNLSKITELPKESKLLHSNGTLIICPASLVHQWNKEIEKRVKKLQLRVHLYHGPSRETRPNRLLNYDIVLTTYNIVSIEGKPFVEEEKEKANKPVLGEWLDASQPKKAESGPIFKLFWRRIVLDEGHTIKNHKTNISIAACSLDAESRWIVTGTPIQNNTMDLYSLIKFLRVSPFDELKFWKHEVDNKTASGRKRMNSIVTSILLRRTKDQNDAKTGKPLVVLPTRSTMLHRLKLSKSENAVYSLVQMFSKNMFTEFLNIRKEGAPALKHRPTKGKEAEMPKEVLGMDVNTAIKMFGLGNVSASSAGCLLVLVLRLRQCCSHLSLMCEALDKDLCKSEGIEIPIEEQLGNMSIDETNFNSQSSRPPELEEKFPSTKVKNLLAKLRELEMESRGKKPIKSVIVSQWTRMLDIVAYHLKRGGFKFDFITGSVNPKKRADIVEDFNSDGGPQVMLVSLKAGGVGLNLIGGSHLFLLDQHWNPSLEDQACDRIYRVGQQNNVVIHRFLCEETVEERIVQLQEKKKELAKSVLYGGKTQKLTLDDLKTIFGFGR